MDLATISKPKESSILISRTLHKSIPDSLSLITVPNIATLYPERSIEYAFISELMDEVEVLSSLQRPKKISLRCSDGPVRHILCKPKDDLRKDMRSLELVFLLKSVSSISEFFGTLYAALPLNEECGIIEWIDNTASIRSILTKAYREKGLSLNFPEYRDLQKRADFATIFSEKIKSQY